MQEVDELLEPQLDQEPLSLLPLSAQASPTFFEIISSPQNAGEEHL